MDCANVLKYYILSANDTSRSIEAIFRDKDETKGRLWEWRWFESHLSSSLWKNLNWQPMRCYIIKPTLANFKLPTNNTECRVGNWESHYFTVWEYDVNSIHSRVFHQCRYSRYNTISGTEVDMKQNNWYI